MNENEKAEQIAALLVERRGYEQRGLDDRVSAVNEALRALGAEGAPPAKRAAKRPSTRKSSETR
jgi:hypothetical protein